MKKITNKERALRIVKVIGTMEPYNEDDLDWQQGITDIMTDIMCRGPEYKTLGPGIISILDPHYLELSRGLDPHYTFLDPHYGIPDPD